jgi:RHS repeat-associated protein
MTRRNLSTIVKLVVILLVVSITSFSQEERNPNRGYRSSNSYSLSDIENVNMSNGNLMLTIPLASLPAGRGTSPGYTVALHYNSKLWNVVREFRTDGVGEGFEDHRYTRELIEQSLQGGWHLDSGFHQLRLVKRSEVEAEAPCYVGEEGYRRNGYNFKLELQLSNGSVTEFKPRSPHASQIADDGFFSLDPWGVKHSYSYAPPNEIAGHPSCSSTHVLVENSGIHYYTDDGSRMRLFIPYQPNVHVSLMRWTLYFPNGQVIENKPQDDTTVHQRLTDRNGNRIVWKTGTLNGVTGLKIENDVGQFIFFGDKIIQPGVNGELLETAISSKSVWVYHKYLATTDINAPSTTQHAELFDSLVVVDKITLPQQLGGLTYEFTYHASDTQPTTGNYTGGWGELASIKLPSGAKADYSYSLTGNDEWMEALRASESSVGSRVLTYDAEHDGETEEISETTSYSVLPGFCCSGVASPDGQNRQLVSLWTGPLKGYVYRTNHASGAVEEKLWVNRRPLSIGFVKIDAFVKTEYTSVADANGNPVLTAITDYDYDQNGNILEVREYDWVPYSSIPRTSTGPFSETLPFPMPTGIPASGLVLKRKTINTYYNPTPNTLNPEQNHSNHHSNPAAPKLLNLIKSTEVRDGSNSAVSRTEFYYDGGMSSPNKGNLTQTRVWDSTRGTYSNPLVTSNWITTSTQYNSFGGPELLTDARGIVTKFIYGPITTPSGDVSDLYPTQTIAAFGTPVARTSAAVYDFYTGLVTTVTDSDNNVSTITTYDDVGRPTLVRAAAGLATETQTFTQYFDAQRRVVVRSDLHTTGDLKLASIQHFDQLGRVRLTRKLEAFSAAGLTDETMGIKVQTRYLNDCQPPGAQCVPASYVLTSNPYRAATSDAAGGETTMGWTRSRADKSGRMIEVQTFAGTTLPAPWATNAVTTGTVATAYDGVYTTVTDQAGKVRRSKVDGLGRLIRVDEPSDAANTLGSQSSPTQATSYQYNALDNLTVVTQGDQTRSFSYSSLSRLTSATNPESGVISYEYDEVGNLKKKTDPRFVPGTSTKRTTTYEYDALGRITSRIYNDSTPNVTYSYDDPENVAYSIGRLTAVSSTVSSYSYGEYDPLGRVKTGTQTTDGQAYAMSYAYNKAGALTSQTYPSGRVITTNYDDAGRIAGVKNAAGSYYVGAASTDAPNRLQYSVHGAIQAMRLDNGLWEHTNFNSRLQAIQIGLGTASTNSSVLKLDSDYGTTTNNSNLRTQTITIPGLTLTQTYTYDELNRLLTARENTGTSWKQKFVYDRYGNRRIDTNPAETSADLVGPNPVLAAANNRIVVQPGEQYQYDDAGNLTRDRDGQTYVFDAEHKMVSFNGGASQGGADYRYDGDGRRVKKVVGTVTTVFVYDVAGKLIAEYSSAAPQTNGTRYLTSDHLGSPRVVTSSSGVVQARHDYHPFGQEVGLRGGRSAANGYVADNLRQKFTTYERDSETQLDYAQARYFAGTQGRFISPDPLLASGRASLPQSWNRYTYVLNSPLILIDPDGLDWGSTEWTDKDGNRHINYHYFTGKVGEYKGRNYTAVKFGSTGAMDINAADGSTVRISNTGILRQVIYAGPAGGGGSGAGLEVLNTTAGLVDGSIPFGRQLREAAFGKMGVDSEAPEYQNAALISEGVAIGATVIVGGGLRVPGCLVANTPARIYSARVLLRAADEPGSFHNFPLSFDDQIFAGTRTVQPNFFKVEKPGLSKDGVMYTAPGSVNGRNGTFEIGVRPSVSGKTEVVIHRFFRP